MSSTTTVLVVDGRIQEFEGLSKVREWGQNFVAAGSNGESVIAVDKYGLVTEYSKGSYVRNYGKSSDGIGIQVSGNGATVLLADGRSDIYIDGQKRRTIGSAEGTPTGVSCSDYPSSARSSSRDAANDAQPDETWMLSLGNKCRSLFSSSIGGVWENIGMVLFSIVGIIICFKYFTNVFVMLVSPLLIIYLSYLFRNVTAKILVRYRIGIPAIIVAYLINVTSLGIGGVALGPWLIFAAIVVWMWPTWPLFAISVLLLGAVAKAFSRR